MWIVDCHKFEIIPEPDSILYRTIVKRHECKPHRFDLFRGDVDPSALGEKSFAEKMNAGAAELTIFPHPLHHLSSDYFFNSLLEQKESNARP